MYYYGYGLDPGYLAIVLVSLVLGGLTQAYINSSYRRWSQVSATAGATLVPGHLTDHYSPRDNSLHLSEENRSGGSVASVAVACHEAGHAIQTAKGYLPYRLRSALIPVVNFAQQTWVLVLAIGVALRLAGLTQLAIALFAFSVLFQLVTLPVEIDASRRAIAYLRGTGAVIDERGARQVLTAAALTYVAAALVSVIQLLYLLNRTKRDEGEGF